METETPTIYGTGYCAECRKRSNIVDQFTESTYERQGEVQFTVDELACGHTVERGHQVVAAAPGAPYAGITAAPSARQRKLGAQIGPAVVDPWAESA